jgi:hypothetical protein
MYIKKPQKTKKTQKIKTKKNHWAGFFLPWMSMTLTDTGPDKHKMEGEKFDSYLPMGRTLPIHVTSVLHLLYCWFLEAILIPGSRNQVMTLHGSDFVSRSCSASYIRKTVKKT